MARVLEVLSAATLGYAAGRAVLSGLVELWPLRRSPAGWMSGILWLLMAGSVGLAGWMLTALAVPSIAAALLQSTLVQVGLGVGAAGCAFGAIIAGERGWAAPAAMAAAIARAVDAAISQRHARPANVAAVRPRGRGLTIRSHRRTGA